MNHFKKPEFTCPCGCGLGFDDIDPVALNAIVEARKVADTPFIITSSIRCKHHNKLVGGSHTSSHLKGLAFDISCTNSSARHKMINSFLAVGFTRIGIAGDFIHVDIDPDKPQNLIWVYK